jgi:hypothetical protein
MSARAFLLATDELQAEMLDQVVFDVQQENGPTGGGGWSGVWTDGTRYGILWGAPVAEAFGSPEDNPELVVVEDTDGVWTMAVVTPDPEP